MKAFYLVALLLQASTLLGSEITSSLKEKVDEADLIVIGKVVDIDLGGIRTWPSFDSRRQLVLIKFKVEQVLLGSAPKDIVVTGYSNSYTKYGVTQSSTTGFSSNGIEMHEKYLAYLTRHNGRYQIASDSNQYFEHVDIANNRVQADGQTFRYSNLGRKLRRITALATEKRRVQQRAAANL